MTSMIKRKKTILIVEDDSGICEIFRIVLEQSNFQCFFAQDGRQAIKIINSLKFDLIVLDILLPSVSGIEVYKFIRKHDNEDIKNTSVIFTTALNKTSDNIKDVINKIPELAENEVLWKPFNVYDLEIKARNKIYNKQSIAIKQSCTCGNESCKCGSNCKCK